MNYKVVFSINAYIKYQAYINKVETEISGLGKVVKHKDEGFFYIEDLILLPQIEATGAYTKFNNSKFYDELIQKGEQPSDYKLWWHSHVNMPVFWSSTDNNTAGDYDIELPEDNWFLSIVGNKKGEILCRLDIFDPIRITLNKIPWEIDFSKESILSLDLNEVDKEIEENFKVETGTVLPLDKNNPFRLRLTAEERERYFPTRPIIIPDNF